MRWLGVAGIAVLAVTAELASRAEAENATIEKVEKKAEKVEKKVAEPAGSVSCGAANRGALWAAAELEDAGPGYTIPEPWRSRGLRYGTDELVGLIRRAAAAVASEYPDSVLGVADLSKKDGGAAASHRSHQSGRDVDLIFYALDPQKKPMAPDDVMPVYTSKGRAYYAESPEWRRRIPERYFDLARNWSLIKALITDPEVEVCVIFVSWRIERWLIEYAEASKEPKDLVRRASVVLKNPRSVKAHHDHMHVRISCPAGDLTAGRCKNDIAPRRRKGRKWYSRVPCPRKPKS